MTIIIVSNTTPRLRGLLRRWLIEPKAGVYLGVVSSRVRDHIWNHVRREVGDGGALLIHSHRGEPGYQIHSHGDPGREILDFDGIPLARIPHPPPSE